MDMKPVADVRIGEHNWQRLSRRFAVDGAAALTAAAVVSPIMTVIDKCVTHNALQLANGNTAHQFSGPLSKLHQATHRYYNQCEAHSQQ